MELTGVVAHREASAAGTLRDVPRPTWDAIGDDMVDYFAQRTGVRVALPAPTAG